MEIWEIWVCGRGKGEKQTDRRLENSNILNKYDNKVGGSKVRVACQKKRAAAKKRNYKKSGRHK